MSDAEQAITSSELAEDLYRALHLSSRNDLYEENNHRRFMQTIEPIIHDTMQHNANLAAATADTERLKAQISAMRAHPREFLGRTVRATWLAYCKETSRTGKPSYTDSWEDISDWDREVDRRIGEAVRQELFAALAAPEGE